MRIHKLNRPQEQAQLRRWMILQGSTDYTEGNRYTDYGHLHIDIVRQETCRVLGDLDHNYRVDTEDFSLFAL